MYVASHSWGLFSKRCVYSQPARVVVGSTPDVCSSNSSAFSTGALLRALHQEMYIQFRMVVDSASGVEPDPDVEWSKSQALRL